MSTARLAPGAALERPVVDPAVPDDPAAGAPEPPPPAPRTGTATAIAATAAIAATPAAR